MREGEQSQSKHLTTREGELASGELDEGDEKPLSLDGGGVWGGGVSWPAVDVIVGNPPFLGGSKMRGELGDDYYERLTAYYDGRLPGFADLVCYWFENAREQIANGKAKRAGLLATNSIRGGANREVLKRIKDTGDIFMAWSDRPWILDGAAVRVSMVGFDGGEQAQKSLDGLPVETVNPDLTATIDITKAVVLRENAKIAFRGNQKGGAFDIDESLATKFLGEVNLSGKSNRDIIKPWWNGLDITRRPRAMWIIDFGEMLLAEARLYEAPLEYVRKFVKPARDKNPVRSERENWWQPLRARPAMRQSLNGLRRYIATTHTSKHRLVVYMNNSILPDHALIAIAREDDYFFGVLHSRLHEVWSLRMGTWLGKGNDPRYTPTTTFETFPFPWPPGREEESHPAHARISAAAARLHRERAEWLNPSTPPQSPQSIGGKLAKSGENPNDELPSPMRWMPAIEMAGGAGGWGAVRAKALKDRTLTNLYNALAVFRGRDRMKTRAAAADFAPRLDQLHRELDEAVCDAYGWEYAVLDDEEDILRRLLALNLDRAG